jgi:outer membrane immunogenic protein
MRCKILLATVVLALMAAPASAADVDTFEPLPPAHVPVATGPMDWSGFYIGVLFGYSFGDAKTGVPLNIDVSGWDGGLYGGTNVQFDRFVLGLEGDALLSSLSGSRAGLGLDSSWAGSLRGRAGIALDQFLLYGTAGLAVRDLEAAAGGFRDSRTLFGWTAGIGIETMISPNVTARVEYRHTEYENKTFTLGAPTDVDLSTDAVRAGVGVRF